MLENDNLKTLVDVMWVDRKNYCLIFLLIAIQLFIILALVICILMFNKKSSANIHYIRTDNSGHIIPTVSNTEINLSNAQLKQWAVEAVSQLNTYNYLNSKNNIHKVTSSYFTENGQQKYYKAIRNSEILESIKAGNLFVDCVVQSTPTLLVKKKINNVQTYKISMNILVGFRSANAERFETRKVELIIVKDTSLPEGVGIDTYEEISHA